jgi:hypothetical protein
MKACDGERPLLLARDYGDTPPRCFLCTRPVEALLEAEGGAGRVDEIAANHPDLAQAHNELLLDLLRPQGEA